jgi:hypothetical protein
MLGTVWMDVREYGGTHTLGWDLSVWVHAVAVLSHFASRAAGTPALSLRSV